jgi:1-acyl-sn-glycerol-3-phosphate acyltransferase
MPTKQRTHWVYYFGRVVIRILIFLVASWKVKGKQNLPKQGPLLIVSNHLHLADPPMTAASIPRKSFFMGKEDLWHNKWTRFWVENFGAFPVRRDTFDREAIRQAEEILRQGYAVIMYPEGGRSKNARLKKGLPGAALIAAHLDAPILPIAITGSEKLLNLGWCFFHRPTITVTFGQSFKLPPAKKGISTRQQRQEMTDYIMGKIAELLPPEYRGYYADEKTGNN